MNQNQLQQVREQKQLGECGEQLSSPNESKQRAAFPGRHLLSITELKASQPNHVSPPARVFMRGACGRGRKGLALRRSALVGPNVRAGARESVLNCPGKLTYPHMRMSQIETNKKSITTKAAVAANVTAATPTAHSTFSHNNNKNRDSDKQQKQ